MTKFILGSGSPRRKELLEQVGMTFSIESAHGDEIITKSVPSEIVMELSGEKAVEVADRVLVKETDEVTVVIGADTMVAFGNDIMGKPKDEVDAKRMLRMLQNNTHQVYTGVTLVIARPGQERKVVQFYEATDVIMYAMTEDQIEQYIATKEPMDKAGAYAIQGKCAAYIQGIKGDYNTVVGLPVGRICQELLKEGICIE